MGTRATSTHTQRLLVVADVTTGVVIRSFRHPGRLGWDIEQLLWEDERTVLIDFLRFRLDGTVERPQLLTSREPECCLYLLPPPVT